MHVSKAVFVIVLMLSASCVAAAEILFVSDFENSHAIQWVRHHGVAYNGISIALGPAYATATMLSGGGNNLTTYLQVPSALNGNPDYPDWSALKTFGSAAAGVPAVGDCVQAEGTIAEFKGATELTTVTITTLNDQDCGGVPISPLGGVGVTAIATDSDLVTPGYQPGPRDEALESVLVQLSSLMAISGNASGDFQVADQFSPNAAVVVGNNLYARATTTGTLFISITGVLDQQDTSTNTVYQLLPRGAGDFNP
jgi:hypothetical protein